ncbi:MAG: hypothetical protein ACP5TL_01220 [Candidatus Micrarchaeia archaeon]
MEENKRTAVVSHSSSGNTKVYKLELILKDKKSMVLWEQNSGVTLETRLNGEGAITQQNMNNMNESEIENEISKIIKSSNVDNIKYEEYKEVTLEKKCPKCGMRSLRRLSELQKEKVPIMPIYVCTNCNTQSYYLTDEYLEYLIYNHNELFAEDEKKELEVDKEAFMEELKAYIIRIFASKKIMCIKD